MLSGAAYAAEAEGQIKKIDIDQLTITLDNGKSYKLPGEFDVSTLKEGMEIVLPMTRSAARTSSPTWICRNSLD